MGFFGAISNFLNGSVGNNLANDPQDVRNTKRNLIGTNGRHFLMPWINATGKRPPKNLIVKKTGIRV